MSEVAQGPRPTIWETGLDDLKFLLEIVQRCEPGSYRASSTIATMEPLIHAFHQRALDTVAFVGLREGDSAYWEALRLAKEGCNDRQIVERFRGMNDANHSQ